MIEWLPQAGTAVSAFWNDLISGDAKAKVQVIGTLGGSVFLIWSLFTYARGWTMSLWHKFDPPVRIRMGTIKPPLDNPTEEASYDNWAVFDKTLRWVQTRGQRMGDRFIITLSQPAWIEQIVVTSREDNWPIRGRIRWRITGELQQSETMQWGSIMAFQFAPTLIKEIEFEVVEPSLIPGRNHPERTAAWAIYGLAIWYKRKLWRTGQIVVGDVMMPEDKDGQKLTKKAFDHLLKRVVTAPKESESKEADQEDSETSEPRHDDD